VSLDGEADGTTRTSENVVHVSSPPRRTSAGWLVVFGHRIPSVRPAGSLARSRGDAQNIPTANRRRFGPAALDQAIGHVPS
jgi:hypothetical protein